MHEWACLCVHVCVIVCVGGREDVKGQTGVSFLKMLSTLSLAGTIQVGQAGWPVDQRDFLAVSPALDYSHTLPCLDCFLQVIAGY